MSLEAGYDPDKAKRVAEKLMEIYPHLKVWVLRDKASLRPMMIVEGRAKNDYRYSIRMYDEDFDKSPVAAIVEAFVTTHDRARKEKSSGKKAPVKPRNL